MLEVEAGQKAYQDFELSVASPGGHSARPERENAIYELADGLARLERFEFPVQFNDATRFYWQRMSKIVGGDQGAAMLRILQDPRDREADALISRNILWHAMLRTTCVATRLSAGHANNALPQRATAIVNCRIFPGVSAENVQGVLTTVLAEPRIKVSPLGTRSKTPAPTPITPSILQPIEIVAGELWPGVPVVPIMSPSATDGVFTIAAGIPTYGVSGVFRDPDGDGVHGLNERVRVRSLYEGREFLYRLVKRYAEASSAPSGEVRR